MKSSTIFRVTIRVIGSLLLFSAIASPALAQGGRQTYTLVPSESSFWVFVGKAGLLSAFAHDHDMGIKSFGGKIVFSEGNIAESTLEMQADTRSLVIIDHNLSEADSQKVTRSMHEVVLESAKYPQASFKSVGINDLKNVAGGEYRFNLVGDLTLHGVTKRVTIPVSVVKLAGQLRANGKYVLKQSDYGIKPFSAAGGSIKVKDEVILNFQMVAR